MSKLSTEQLAQTVILLQKIGRPDEVYEAIFDLLRSVVDFDAATLFEKQAETQELTVAHQYGEQVVDLAPEVELDAGSGLSAWICRQKAPVILESIAKSRAGRYYQINSFVALPLWAKDEFLGVLNFAHHKSGMYSKELKSDFQVVANQLALAMERIRLQNTIQQQNEQLRAALQELKNTQQQLIDKERLAAVGEIVITVNHEINNPLTAIMGAADLAQVMLGMNQPEKVGKHLTMILESANRIKRITEKISALKKAKAIPYVGDYSMLEIPSD